MPVSYREDILRHILFRDEIAFFTSLHFWFSVFLSDDLYQRLRHFASILYKEIDAASWFAHSHSREYKLLYRRQESQPHCYTASLHYLLRTRINESGWLMTRCRQTVAAAESVLCYKMGYYLYFRRISTPLILFHFSKTFNAGRNCRMTVPRRWALIHRRKFYFRSYTTQRFTSPSSAILAISPLMRHLHLNTLIYYGYTYAHGRSSSHFKYLHLPLF